MSRRNGPSFAASAAPVLVPPPLPSSYNLLGVVGPEMRSYLLASGLVVIMLGLFLLFAGYEKVGCTVGGSSNIPTFTNCNGATELEEAGAFLTLVAVLLFAGAIVPDSSSRYK